MPKKSPIVLRAVRALTLIAVALFSLPACFGSAAGGTVSCPIATAVAAGLRAFANEIDPGSCGSSGQSASISACYTINGVKSCTGSTAEGATTVDVCEPVAGDTSCVACLRSSCCQQLAEWRVNVVAVCLAGCQEQHMGTLEECEASDLCTAGPDEAYNDFAACTTGSGACASECSGMGIEL